MKKSDRKETIIIEAHFSLIYVPLEQFKIAPLNFSKFIFIARMQ